MLSKKEMHKINNQLTKDEARLNALRAYSNTLSALQNMVTTAEYMVKRTLPHEAALEHLKTFTVIYRDLRSMMEEETKAEYDTLVEQKELLEQKENQ